MADTHKAAPPSPMPVSETVQEQIHFDTLWATTQAALEVYAGQRWTAREDDDPGVTLLQAFAYGVSDVSYRHTLPLIDVLTEKALPAPSSTDAIHLDHAGGIFAPEFGPERALTSSPVTLDDYRRAILDLTIPENGHDVFCFRDAQIAKVPAEKSYQYYYNPNNYAFQFQSPTSDNANKDGLHAVSGQYWLAVTPTPGIDKNCALTALVNYLKNHRNLCEQEIVPQSFVPVKCQNPKVQLFLDDDLPEDETMIPVVAQALWAINLALLPAAIREPAASRLARGETAEQVYAGPQLEHGWITHLPSPRPMDDAQLGALAVNVQGLSAAVVGAVPGVNAVNWGDTSEITVPKNQQVQLWVDQAGALQAPAKSIELYKRGQLIATARWEDNVIAAYHQLNQTARRATKDPLRSVPYGRNRHPEFYRTVGASLPPLYGLQQAAAEVVRDNNAKNLLQFLRPFEQLLANRADQLKKLPRLLAFDGRDPGAAVWGAAHWPQQSDDPLAFEQTHRVVTSAVMGTLTAEINDQSQDNEKELAILDHLLGYFGERRAPRALNASANNEAEFRHVQQGFLRQVTRLAYERASISISRISALQRKVAARLGVGEALFDEHLQQPDAAFPQQQLPFYMIEHQELLPQNLGAQGMRGGWPTGQTVSAPTVSKDTKLLTLTLTLTGEAATKLKPGQLIELMGSPKNGSDKNLPTLEPLTALVIHDVTPGASTTRVKIELGQQSRLERTVPLLQDSQYQWFWQSSDIWLRRVVYDVAFVTVPTDVAGTATLKVTPSFPVELTKGQRFALRPRGRWLSWPTANDITGSGVDKLPDVVVEVVSADPLGGTVEVRWIAQSVPTITTKEAPGETVVPPVELKKLEPNAPKWSLLNNVKTPYAWSMPYGNDSFAFTLSIVLNRAWLQGSQNPGALSQWIQNIVREEMPSHLKLQLHWLDASYFTSFAHQYEMWQRDSRPVGDQSYELLHLLGIGDRPVDERAGIGFVRIVNTQKSREIETRIAKENGRTREEALKHESVVYVRGSETAPPTLKKTKSIP